MSRLAIVAAMHDELRAVLQAMPDEVPRVRAGREFWVGHLDGHEVVAVLAGIGKVAAATTATLLITEFQVDRILFTGVAGGLGEHVRVGDVVVADGLTQHDMDASPLFPRFEVPLTGVSRFVPDAALSDVLWRAAQTVLAEAAGAQGEHLDGARLRAFGITAPRGHRGLIISGDRFVSTQNESEALRQALPEALAVEMEGAALAQVCHDFNVPCAVVRTVSDRADDAAHVDFNRFMAEVAAHYSLAIVRRALRLLAA
ncbi:5'-methylthioadenosine/adenosylhomocysteine nucleosidase [Aquabacterium sp.]|uniref:5'-methylthioadenosine/adenosylhomocysteine nucleosidase n=1 Tax=Aquabacterium sp. TaxID=1872578 RepID=UPI0035B19467